MRGEFKLPIGRTTLGIVCSSERYADSLRACFRTDPVVRPSDLRLVLEIDETSKPGTVPRGPFQAKTGGDGAILGRFWSMPLESTTRDAATCSWEPRARANRRSLR